MLVFFCGDLSPRCNEGLEHIYLHPAEGVLAAFQKEFLGLCIKCLYAVVYSHDFTCIWSATSAWLSPTIALLRHSVIFVLFDF